jgi:hypothetical protein
VSDLTLDPATFRRLGYLAVDAIAARLEALPDAEIDRRRSRAEMEAPASRSRCGCCSSAPGMR